MKIPSYYFLTCINMPYVQEKHINKHKKQDQKPASCSITLIFETIESLTGPQLRRS